MRTADLQRQVADTERAFAKTMADRNHAAFTSFLADETIFFTSTKALRGKSQVADFWKRFYEGPTAAVFVAARNGRSAGFGRARVVLGPVRDPQGKLFATFTSIWRLEAPGTWRIIFDKGNEVCDCPKP